MSHAVDEKQICQYLLGRLGLEEQQRFEEQLMTQESLFDELMVLEDELIDDYLKGTLSPVDRADFEKHFLATPERQQKLQFSQALRKHVAAAALQQSPAPLSRHSFWQSFLAPVRAQSPSFRYGFQAALSAVIVAGLWMGGTTWRLSTQVAQIRTEQSGSRERERQLQQQLAEQREFSQALEQQLAQAQAPQTQKPAIEKNTLPSMVALPLTFGAVRDSGTFNRVTIPSDARRVELKIELGDNRYQDYRAVLESKGSEILVVNKLRPERIGTNQFIVLPLPAYILPHEDYSLKLSGVSSTGEFDPLGSYSFRVLRK